jgi:eukaryotic-like serine/threonine-protein kinase
MEDRPTEIQRPWSTPPEPPPPPPGGPEEPPPGPPPGAPPPWYREYWWIWLLVLLLIVGGIIAFFALRDSGDDEGAQTQTGGPPKVPNVVGTQEEIARDVLQHDGFEVEVVRQPTDQRTGVVVEQDPEAGSKLAQGSTVRIVVSTGLPPTTTVTETETVSGPSGESGPETVEMPDVTGDDYVDAVDELVDAGVFPDFIPIESSEERGTVVKQSPESGEDVEQGASVRLDVALGDGEREDVDVPDLTGMDVGDALNDCAKAGLACRTIAGGPDQKDVVGQEPPAGGTAPALSIVNLLTGS